MKRDFDVIRELLFQVENSTCGGGDVDWVIFDAKNTSKHEVIYHVRLLTDLGLFYSKSVILNGKDIAGCPVAKFYPDALTNEGHEFLETIRDSEVWSKTKEGVNSIGSHGFDLIKKLAKGYVDTKIKKLTGIELSS